MHDSKLLTILIPVYNGGYFLQTLLESFASYVDRMGDTQGFISQCEIVLIDNQSQDQSFEVAKCFESRIGNLRVIRPDLHVPSAEENVFRSFKFCRGEYTWVLGCDDIVRFEALGDVLQVARDGKYDIAMFNYLQSNQDGKIENTCNYYMSEPVYEATLIELVQRLGYWWLIAGFSGQIVRTSRVRDFDHAALVDATSPIYSHVTAYLLCLADRPAAIVNVQSVIYRLSDNDINHWQRAAQRFHVFNEYFWTLGYVRQLSYLEERGIIDHDFLVRMIEANRNGFFRPTVVIYNKLLAQLKLSYREGLDSRNSLTHDEFREIVGYFESRDLLARTFLHALGEIQQQLENRQSVSSRDFDDAKARLEEYSASYLLLPNFAGIQGDYELYQLGNTCYAVHHKFRGALLDLLRYLDHRELDPVLFCDTNIAGLRQKIRLQGVGLGLAEIPDRLMRYCSEPIERGVRAWFPREVQAVMTPPERDSLISSLLQAQQQLTATYKSKASYLVRLTAWTTVIALKSIKRLLKKRSNRGLQAANDETIRKAA